MTFGFSSALDIATDAIDRLHTTAHSHRRALVIEIMGNRAGWLTLYAGLAGGGDVIIIPEIPYDINIIYGHVKHRMDKKGGFSVIAVAEGAISVEEAKLTKKELKKKRAKEGLCAAERVSNELNKISDFETRYTVLGYLQRGGTPSPFDRVLATQCGTAAAELLYRGEYNKMLVMRGNDVTSIPIEEVAEKTKLVPEDNLAIQSAKLSGTCFGDELIF
jgi:6-phosphofructokinase 1